MIKKKKQGKKERQEETREERIDLVEKPLPEE